jgi:putative ABC transport system substrate-binding protein
LPGIYSSKEDAEAGGLMSYGAAEPEMIRLALTYIDRILKGASPTNLPIVQPPKFEFVINSRTAWALSIAITPSLLARADKVIE